MTIEKIPFKNMCTVEAYGDYGGKPIAIECFADELNAEAAMRLLRAVLIEANVKLEAKKNGHE